MKTYTQTLRKEITVVIEVELVVETNDDKWSDHVEQAVKNLSKNEIERMFNRPSETGTSMKTSFGVANIQRRETKDDKRVYKMALKDGKLVSV